MREFKKLPLELFIGYDIEQNSRVIELDASEMVEQYPSGVLQLVCKRPGEETTYIAPSFEQDGGTLRWTLTSYDVEKAGQGLAIVALVDTSGESVKVLASHKIRTGIEEGLHFRDAETVDPEDSLIARVLAAVSQAQAYAQDAKEEADRAEAADDAVEDAKDQAIADIETKGAETLASIPQDYTALSGDVSDLKSAISFTTETGCVYFNPPISWINAYVRSNGVITSSSASITGLVTMHPGESVKIGTLNSNITIIGSTSASSIAVGDSVTQIQTTTSSGNYEEYTYTAQEQINIVLCVNKSNYNIQFYKESKFSQNIENKITALHGETFTETDENKQKLEYTATSGTSIFESNTRLNVNYPSGTIISVVLSADSSIVSSYYLYFNGVALSGTKQQNQRYTFVLTENVTRISYFVDNTNVTGSGLLTLTVARVVVNNSSLEKRIVDLETNDALYSTYVPTAITDGYILTNPDANGSFLGSGVLTNARNRIRTGLLPFKKNEKIIISNGTFEHSVGVWRGTPSVSTGTRNDTSWITTGETIEFDYDGYIVIVFRKSNNADVTPVEFDGAVYNYNTFAYRSAKSPDELPAYYTAEGYLTNKISRINALGKQGDDVFVFITDVHWELNAKNSPALIRRLNEGCAIHKIFDCGDVANASRLDVYKLYRNAVSGKSYHIAGNHDWFPPTDGKDLYYGMDSANNDQIGNAFDHYWYVDNVQQKIRYIALNSFYHEGDSTGSGWTNYDTEQINWFEGTALNLPGTDWDVIVFTHYLKTTSYLTGGTAIGNAIDAFNAQAGHTGKVLAVFQGHTHWDGIYHTAGGVPVITTTCDKWNLSNESSTIPPEGIAFRQLGTLSETAFDVVILNRSEKKFTCVRIGAPAQDNIDKYRTDTGFTWIGTLEEREISYGEE